RIEGHLAIRIEVESQKIVKAFSAGEMFRGFETILAGRDPMDAQQITQRICGVCPVSHGIASVYAQDMAYGISPPENGRILRNLIQGANYIQDHILHFYQLSALDFIDIAAVTGYTGKDPDLNELKSWVKSEISSNALFPAAPFLPRYKANYIENSEINISAIKNYLEAFDMRRVAHKMGAVFAGKLPHAASIVPGGVTVTADARSIASYREMLIQLRKFIDNAYIPDILAVASELPEYFTTGKGCNNFLAYGAFPESSSRASDLFPQGTLINGRYEPVNKSRITEDVKFSRFSSPSGAAPFNGETIPDPEKYNAYSWIKAPRYNRNVMEVGPLARLLVAYHSRQNQHLYTIINNFLNKLNIAPERLVSVLGRHAARALECKIVADQCAKWIDQLRPDEPCFNDFKIPESGKGIGLTEACRGALGHWIKIKNYKIDKYQCVVPTTWNCSPRDDRGVPGPVEQALEGTKIQDGSNPIEAVRVVRSFDPCLACAVH
ncbi:MAG: nickel-dependent hydrogenase large subunit, partial [Thermodesulfobacteriota bacterium]|nr:nickel-dependent hydrogenase large subunit [Thermodesulfobacteriota bacterium]